MPPPPFAFTPFGGRTHEDAITCDGLVDGASAHASHWAGNRTPAALKADTSVEIALRYNNHGLRPGARVTNNHFDTDGVLAVYTLLSPDTAARHANLVTAAAEAGDFDEWPHDERGLQLEIAIRAIAARASGEEHAYRLVLPALDHLIEDLDGHRQLWEQEWNALLAADRRADEGAIEITRHHNIAVILHRPGVDEMPGPVLHKRAPQSATRWLLAFEQPGGAYRYRYERRRWAWADTVRRPPLLPPSRNAIAQDLGPGWALKGSLGMTGLLRTTAAVRTDPSTIAAAIARRDPGAR